VTGSDKGPLPVVLRLCILCVNLRCASLKKPSKGLMNPGSWSYYSFTQQSYPSGSKFPTIQ
jgi:hypothetical protein